MFVSAERNILRLKLVALERRTCTAEVNVAALRGGALPGFLAAPTNPPAPGVERLQNSKSDLKLIHPDAAHGSVTRKQKQERDHSSHDVIL